MATEEIAYIAKYFIVFNTLFTNVNVVSTIIWIYLGGLYFI